MNFQNETSSTLSNIAEQTLESNKRIREIFDEPSDAKRQRLIDDEAATKKLEEDKRREKIQMLGHFLSPLEPTKRHQDFRSIRIGNTAGTWLLEDLRFIHWRDGTKTTPLCCYGVPGAGKTVISSIVIDHLESKFPQSDGIGIAYVYCDYRDQEEQTVVNIVGSILIQLLLQISNPLRLPNVTRRLEDKKQQCKRVKTADILFSLRFLLLEFKHVFICLDALDELKPKDRIDLLNLIHSEFNPAVENRVFLTGRHQIKPEVDQRFQQGTTEIEIIADASDIRAYLHHKIVEDTHINSDSMNGHLQADIVNTITERSKGM